MRSNGVLPPAVPTPQEPDWKLVAQTAMQQRDRASQMANNLEIDLIMARAQVEALERVSGITAAAALATDRDKVVHQTPEEL